jgi:hypothetical protein
MYVESEHHVRLTVSIDQDVEGLLKNIESEEGAQKGGAAISLPSSDLSANLDGDPDSFTIGLVDSIQSKKVEKGLEARWTWRVRPKKLGNYDLTLTVFSNLLTNGKNVFKQTVRVRVGLAGTEQLALNNVATYLLSGGALCGGLLLSIQGLRKWIQKRRQLAVSVVLGQRDRRGKGR